MKLTFAKQFTASLVALRAQAFVRAREVDAFGVLSARVRFGALVDVRALTVGRLLQAGRTGAPVTAGHVGADRTTVTARITGALVNVCSCVVDEMIARLRVCVVLLLS
uniref:Putative secreted peptide n=1 Tax=Anopheles braziliensis TaxID=58242 RepID=A0A2M3ZSG9_9DIPT